MNKLEIFKPGKHTAMSGAVIEFSEADLKATAGAYDPTLHEAPFVVGHPEHDKPAYGWAKSLSYSGTLDVEPGQVDPAFAEMVNKGHFKKISASFYAPDSPKNPKPGVYYLRHVGFLGAMPPAVKGLKSAAFADGEEGIVEFADWTDVQSARILRRLRDWLIAKFGSEEADKAIPGYEVDSLQEQASASAAKGNAFSERKHEEPQMTDLKKKEDEIAAREQKIADREAAVAAKETSFSEREKSISAAESKARRVEHDAYVEGLIKEGKIIPAHKAGLVEFMAGLSADAVVEFGEGDKKEKKPVLDWFKGYLAAQPKVVDFQERAAGTVVDLDNADAIAKEARKYVDEEAKAGRTVSYAEAVAHVTQAQK